MIRTIELLGAPLALFLCMTSIACTTTSVVQPRGPVSFGSDLAFLKQHANALVLSDSEGRAQAIVVPEFQGRVMTSTANGLDGASQGWIHRELIASKKREPHINAFGGEDRFWLGPEGGQYSIFFPPGASFDFDHWQTPAPIDSEAFELVEHERDRAMLKKRMELTNWSGTRFELEVTREVRMRDPSQVLAAMRVDLPKGVAGVAFETINTVTNTGSKPWTKDGGLLSIWILGMFPANDATTVAIPFETGPASVRGPIVNDEYFGKVPADRLRVDEQRGLVLFRADGSARGKVGVGPKRAVRRLGSFDAERNVLTLVEFSLPKDDASYVNSLWKHQDDPYGGDVVNSYNDGPAKPGAKQLGRFYELETSSPALALAPRGKATHVHRTVHLTGERASLEPIARAVFGVGLSELTVRTP